MVWFKVDDRFVNHPKWMALDDDDKLACIGLWTALGAWSAGYLTDGRVPDRVVAGWRDGIRLAALLVDAGLLSRTANGYQFHDWRDWQPTKAEVLAERERWRVNQEKSRRKRGTVTDDTPVSLRGVTGESTGPVPSRPLKDLSSERSEKMGDETPRDDVQSLVTRLRDLIAANGSPTPIITKPWRDSARLLLDRDKVPLADALRVMDWSQQDDFWRANILSLPKFRKQYAALRLRMLAQEPEPVDTWANMRRLDADNG